MGFAYQQQQGYEMHEESWQSENEHFGYGSGMQVLPRPSYPKPSNHQMMHSESHTMYQDGWQGNHSMPQDGWQGHYMHQNGWQGHNMRQDSWQGHNMHQNGWQGSGVHFSHASNGKPKPNCGMMNDAQFSHSHKFKIEDAGFGDNTFHQVHVPAQAVVVQEMSYEHSNWQNGGGGHLQGFDDFNWMRKGCKNAEWVAKAV